MGDTQGEALATIGEIAQGHGDIVAAVRVAKRSPLERLIAAWWEEVDDSIARHPYQATASALAVGFLGGLALALANRQSHSRGW